MSLLTTKEVAERLGVTMKRVQAMIRDGRLPAQKMGRDNFIKEEDLRLVADRKPGRPPKPKDKKASKVSKKRGSKKQVAR
jgi:excisionase family DNA binding protein